MPKNSSLKSGIGFASINPAFLVDIARYRLEFTPPGEGRWLQPAAFSFSSYPTVWNLLQKTIKNY